MIAAKSNETTPSRFGHFRAEVPKSLHIGAYPRRIADRGRLPRRCEAPASGHIYCPLVSEMGLIAMQKVEGSNPFSRFFANPLHVLMVLSRPISPRTSSV
jgi:hypothetical protein